MFRSPADFVDGVAALEAGGGLDFVGASGALDFDPETGDAPGDVGVAVLEDGHLVPWTEFTGSGRCLAVEAGRADACPPDGPPACHP